MQRWKDAWVHHPLRTEENKTVMKLWIGGLHFTQFGQRILEYAQEPLTQVCRRGRENNARYAACFIQQILPSFVPL